MGVGIWNGNTVVALLTQAACQPSLEAKAPGGGKAV